jgi:hypothetical protein
VFRFDRKDARGDEGCVDFRMLGGDFVRVIGEGVCYAESEEVVFDGARAVASYRWARTRYGWTIWAEETPRRSSQPPTKGMLEDCIIEFETAESLWIVTENGSL